MTAWIRMIALEEASGKLKEMYELAKTPAGTVDNVMRAHSLRPHSMQGHLALYRNVLHNPDNTLPFWFLEVVASYVSMSNKCDYSLTHHWANARRLINDKPRSQVVWDALSSARPELAFDGKELAFLNYARKLTVDVANMQRSDYDALRAAGCDDGEILEVNQVCAYFNYSNRLLNGLGVTTEGDVVGYYKEPDAD
ncbi:MAG TPA: peroxidase-related enzyme [Burkholderiaceae bacterium]|nr:peroxidase-related enzyme [Burkholderiaceae bacterium]